jgi:hypothetical protein
MINHLSRIGITNSLLKGFRDITVSGSCVCESNYRYTTNGTTTFTLPSMPTEGTKIAFILNGQYNSGTSVRIVPTSNSSSSVFDNNTGSYFSMNVADINVGGAITATYSPAKRMNRCRFFFDGTGSPGAYNFRNPRYLTIAGYNGSSWITLYTNNNTTLARGVWFDVALTGATQNMTQYRFSWTGNENGATTTVVVNEIEYYSTDLYGTFNSFILNKNQLPKIGLLGTSEFALTYVNGVTGWIVSSGNFPNYTAV